MKKGLRRGRARPSFGPGALKEFPDEEGIKTAAPLAAVGVEALKEFPDEEGIKTGHAINSSAAAP